MINKKNKILVVILILLGINIILLLQQPDFYAFTERDLQEEIEGEFEEEIEEEPIDTEAVIPEIHFSHWEVAPGDYLGISIKDLTEEDAITVDTNLLDTPLQLTPYDEGVATLVPVSYHTSPGSYKIRVEINRNEQPLIISEALIVIYDKEFEAQHLRVNAEQEEVRSIGNSEEDRELIRNARSNSSNIPLWEGSFLQPVEGRISTEFGVVRYVNNELTGYRHSGLDIASPLGTPIKTTNSGVVTLARSFNVSGETIIIDHGLNVFSSYYHLDKIIVVEGDRVEKGDVIGEVGSTGFSTGPHLHWSMHIGHTVANPWKFLDENPLDLFKAGD